jgi:hypothetical protein
MKDIKFQYYPANVYITEPLGEISLERFILANKSPKKEIQDVFKQIFEAVSIGDIKKKDELKQSKLFYFNPCIITDGKGRSYNNITGFTGLLVMDFDKLENANELKHEVFNFFKSCICAYLSPSGKGVKFLFKIPVVKSVEEFKEYFYGLSYYLSRLPGYDLSAQNPSLPLFISWDPDMLYREDAKIWRRRGKKIDEFKSYVGDIVEAENITEHDKKRVRHIVTKSMSRIEDSGHPIVRSTALSAGGYVAAGYYQHDEMLDILYDLIDSSDYCSKNIRGYKKTASEMLKKGMTSPLYLAND